MEAEGTIMSSFNNESVNKCFPHQQPTKPRLDDNTSLDSRPSSKPCFDCSICLDCVVDPVVTLCGHLYCWTCIYKWLQIDTPNHDCPVCKYPLSRSSLVPVYGRGASNKKISTSDRKSIEIPNRPAYSRNATGSQLMQHDHYYPSQGGGGGMFNSTAGGVLGGLVIAILPLVSRYNNQGGETNFWRTSRAMMGRRDERERRIENSLHQIWMFLFCCSVLCWLFF